MDMSVYICACMCAIVLEACIFTLCVRVRDWCVCVCVCWRVKNKMVSECLCEIFARQIEFVLTISNSGKEFRAISL